MGATVGTLLADAIERLRAAGVELPRLDAELLLGHATGAGRTALLAHPEAPVGADAAADFASLVARRAAGEPVAYLRGLREFLGIALASDPRALVPRPETEGLVELAEEAVVRRLAGAPRPAGSAPLAVADVGTGSGAIAVALAVRLRRRGMLDAITLLATDLSGEALALARENAVAHAVADAIELVEADLLPPAAGPFELVCANLPYIPTDALATLPAPTRFEPRAALDGGPDGLAVIDRLLARLPGALAPGGEALLEIGADQGDAIGAHAAALLPGWSCTVVPDLAGLPRIARLSPPVTPTGAATAPAAPR